MRSRVLLALKKPPVAQDFKGKQEVSVENFYRSKVEHLCLSEPLMERGRQALDMIRDSQGYIDEFSAAEGIDFTEGMQLFLWLVD